MTSATQIHQSCSAAQIARSCHAASLGWHSRIPQTDAKVLATWKKAGAKFQMAER